VVAQLVEQAAGHGLVNVKRLGHVAAVGGEAVKDQQVGVTQLGVALGGSGAGGLGGGHWMAPR
jgi:hypothetical protein